MREGRDWGPGVGVGGSRGVRSEKTRRFALFGMREHTKSCHTSLGTRHGVAEPMKLTPQEKPLRLLSTLFAPATDAQKRFLGGNMFSSKYLISTQSGRGSG